MAGKVLLSYPLVNIVDLEFIESSDTEEFGVRTVATARYDLDVSKDLDYVLYAATNWMSLGVLPPRAVKV